LVAVSPVSANVIAQRDIPIQTAPQGIGGYDLQSQADLTFAFDYDHTGYPDHLVLYRPGTGIIQILSNVTGIFTPVFRSAQGIGGWDLLSPNDRIFPIDYEGSGLSDYLLIYRPGTGIVWILKNTNGTFTPVFNSTSGIGGYDLALPSDRLFAFDYDGSGLSDHIVAYRPGTGIIFIIGNQNGTFSPVYQSSTGLDTIGLTSADDRLIPFDYYGIGSTDHLVLYRPGSGMIYIMENLNGTFTPVYQSQSGIGGYDLKSASDKILAFDYNGTGNQDHLLLYRPGTGIAWILQNSYFNFTPVYQSLSGANGFGIGGYDLLAPVDLITPFDYDSTGKLDHLVLYRPGGGIAFVEQNQNGVFTPLYRSSTSAPE